MKKGFLIILAAALALFSSCTTDFGNPIAASYRVSGTEESTVTNFFIQLKDDGTFILIQAGGENSDEAYIIRGEYEFSLNSFDFINGYGKLAFNAQDIPRDGLVLKEGNNFYDLYFSIDKDSGLRTMDLIPIGHEGNQVISKCFSISDSAFESALKSAMGGVEQ